MFHDAIYSRPFRIQVNCWIWAFISYFCFWERLKDKLGIHAQWTKWKERESLRFKLNGNGTNLTRDGNDNYQNTSDDPAIKGRVKVWRQKSLTKYEKIVDWANSQFSCVTRDLNSKYTARHLDYQTWMCLTSPVDWSPQLQKRYQKRSFKNCLDQFLRFLQISTFWNLYFFLYTFRFCLYF